MHIRFIFNPKSGREKAASKLQEVIRYLFEDGHMVSMRFTKEKHDGTRFAQEAVKDQVDRLVAVGGDGTVNEVASGLIGMDSKIPLAIIPAGTVNDFATYMNLPLDTWEILKTIVGDTYVDVDCGLCGDKHFLNVGAAGIFTDVAHKTSSEMKSALGRVAYVFQALKGITPDKLRPMALRLTSKERTAELRAHLFIIANTKSVGGFARMAPLASVTDGMMDVVVVKEMPLTDLVTTYMRIRDGEHIHHPKVEYFKSAEIFVESEEDVEVDIDGEYYGNLPVRFKVIPAALRLLI